jgi:hypothetical protein
MVHISTDPWESKIGDEAATDQGNCDPCENEQYNEKASV